MPINVYGDNEEKTIIVRKMLAPWTWGEYSQAIMTIHKMLGEVDHRVDVIADCTEIDELPNGAAIALAKAHNSLPTNVRYQYVVASTYFIQLFNKMLAQVQPGKQNLFIYKTNMEVAYQSIEASYIVLE